MNKISPYIVKGESFTDERRGLEFYNDFDMSPIKRQYFDTNIIRAWQGHTIERPWFIYVKGSFTVKLIEIDNWEKPSKELKVLKYKLTSEKPEILYIPSVYVNGFKALQKDSKLMIMSNYGFNEVENDEFRFDKNKWVKWDD